MGRKEIEKEIGFLNELERGARTRGDWLQAFEFEAVREARERQLEAHLRINPEKEVLR